MSITSIRRIHSNETHYLVDDRPLYVYVNDVDKRVYISKDKISVDQTPCGYKITVAVGSYPTVTLVLPVKSGHIIVGDEWGYVNTDYPSKYYCAGPTKVIPLESSEIIYAPIVHIIDGETVQSCSVFGEAQFTFCKDAYEQYIEVTGVPHQGEIIFYIDQSCNYKVNLQRPIVQRRKTYYYDLLDLSDMNRAIYYGSEIIPVKSSASADVGYMIRTWGWMVTHIKDIQFILDQEHIHSIITGSVAEQLNGINCSVSDCDFMLPNHEDVLRARDILLEHGYIWQGGYITRSESELKVGLSHDNYRIMNTHKHCEKELNGIRYLSVEGLMLLSLLNCYEFHRSPYPNYYKKNDRTLLRLTKYAHDHSGMCNNKVAGEIEKISAFIEPCIALCNRIKDVPIAYLDIRVNEPFRVNCFENEHSVFFSIINLGPKDHCRVVTSCNIKSAEWLDVSGGSKGCRIEDHQSFRLLFINDVSLPGILICSKGAY